MTLLPSQHDFRTDDADLLATCHIEHEGMWEFYEHPVHEGAFPIVAVQPSTGLKFNTGHYDIEAYLYGADCTLY